MQIRNLLATLAVMGCMAPLWGQRESYDVVTFAPPAGWTKRETQGKSATYAVTDSRKGTFAQLSIYPSSPSKGSPEADLEQEWRTMVADPFRVKEAPALSGVVELQGWKRKSAAANFLFEGRPATALVTTFTGGGRLVTVVVTYSSREYFAVIDGVINSIELRGAPGSSAPNSPVPPASTNAPGRFGFTSTNFDDGWVSTAMEGWTEVKKGGVRVLVHYPLPQADAYHSVLRDGDMNAWNLLVAPRYMNVRNFEWKTIQSFESITFLRADATERATGRAVHVVLFKKHSSKGNGRYLEFVADSRGAYEAEFGPYHNDEFNWDKNANMQFRNKFAVAAGDLVGTWKASDYASLSYYYVSTGGFAGATATSTADQFTFLAGNRYQSEHTGASGAVGNQKWSRQVYQGAAQVSNWTMTLTNRFQGAAETYQCQFEAIRGGRILLMTDRLGTTLSLVRGR